MPDIFLGNFVYHCLIQGLPHLGHPPRPAPFGTPALCTKPPSTQFIESFYEAVTGKAAKLGDSNVAEWENAVPWATALDLEIADKCAFAMDRAHILPRRKNPRKVLRYFQLPTVGLISYIP